MSHKAKKKTQAAPAAEVEGYWTLPTDGTVSDAQRLGNTQVAGKMSFEAARKKTYSGKCNACPSCSLHFSQLCSMHDVKVFTMHACPYLFPRDL